MGAYEGLSGSWAIRIIALLVSVIGGAIVTFCWSELWHWYLHKSYPEAFPGSDRDRVIAISLGVLERGVFTALVLWLPAAVGAPAGAWIVVKSAAGWGALAGGKEAGRSRFYVALMGSLVSISWAMFWGIWGAEATR